MRACLGVPGKPCARPVAKGSRCATCKREYGRRRRAKAKALGLTGERGSTYASRKIRERVLERANGVCFYCGGEATVSDHFIPLSKGGADTEENQVAACISCNQRKADKMPREFLREIRGGRRRGHITVLVGPPGSGKSTVAELLATSLQIPCVSVDDFGNTGPRRWKELLRWLGDRSAAIVEANVVQPAFARLLGSVEHTVIRLDAPRSIRAERIARRGDSAIRRRRLLGYRPAVYTYPADREIDTSGSTPEQAAEQIKGWVEKAQQDRADVVGTAAAPHTWL